MRFIYIIGAQCTGKTTLSAALTAHLNRHNPELKCVTISEVARSVLRLHGFTRDDVRKGGQRCLELQKLIMENQLNSEREAAEPGVDIVVSDRSGIDPLVYAHMYCEPQRIDGMLHSEIWAELKNNLLQNIVIVCEPVEEWLVDDGTRIMPLNFVEWMSIHTLFLDLLDRHEIQHLVLPATIHLIPDRVNFIQSLLKIDGVDESCRT